jgi:O-methyltransferase
MMLYETLIHTIPIISDQITEPGLRVVLRELSSVLEQNTAGDITEFGCYNSTTSLFIRRLLDEQQSRSNREFHVYDSFIGLPAKTAQDESSAGTAFQAGELASSKKQFLHEFQKARLTPPIIHKGWFNDLNAHDVPEEIAYAFLDGDFYHSILTSLQLVWPRLSPGGIVTIDDYGQEALPGVARAVHNYFNGRLPKIHHEHNIAILRKN